MTRCRSAREAFRDRWKTAAEELYDIYLSAGSRKRKKIEVVNMDIAVLMRLRVVGIENKHIVKLLCALRAVFKHDAHGSVTVDIGIFTLDVRVARVGKRDLLIRLH